MTPLYNDLNTTHRKANYVFENNVSHLPHVFQEYQALNPPIRDSIATLRHALINNIEHDTPLYFQGIVFKNGSGCSFGNLPLMGFDTMDLNLYDLLLQLRVMVSHKTNMLRDFR